MSNVMVVDRLHGLKVRRIKSIWPRMSLRHQPYRHAPSMAALRPIFSMLIAVAMLFAPFAIQSGSAMATARADHQSQMMEKGHCGEQPAEGTDGKAVDKSCCVAMCTAIAIAAVAALEPHAFAKSADRTLLAQYQHGFLAKLPTPPPRRA